MVKPARSGNTHMINHLGWRTGLALGIAAVCVGAKMQSTQAAKTSVSAPAKSQPKAPELVGSANQWLNTDGRALSLASRKGKVTIVEFWTFECSNCRANLPAYSQWAEKYRGRGVEVIGVHTPELPEERNPKNVARFARERGISYPILIDGQGANWNRWKQQYWPTVYVVDGDGQVAFKWEGELGSDGGAQVEHAVNAALDNTTKPVKIMKTDAEWKKELSPKAYNVLRQAGTEAPYTGALWNNHEHGIYKCAGCGLELFSSDAKFESGTGWPSFYQPIRANAVEEHEDGTLGMTRTEVLCPRCGGHLGHVFDDGPKPTGLRFCMNSAAMTFDKK